MKLLFLDIDGVLNSKRSQTALGYLPTPENLDPVALGLMKYVVKYTGCVIALSSSWRFAHNFMDLGKQLKLPILFETTHYELEYRAQEIDKLLKETSPSKYAILDDNEQDDEFIHMNFVKVDPDNGVSYHNYLQLLELLK